METRKEEKGSSHFLSDGWPEKMGKNQLYILSRILRELDAFCRGLAEFFSFLFSFSVGLLCLRLGPK